MKNVKRKMRNRRNRIRMTRITRIHTDESKKWKQNIFSFELLFYAFRLETEFPFCTFYSYRNTGGKLNDQR